jgi:FtsH-binding integral membrane protein
MTGFVGMIFPFGHTFEMVYSAGGALIFSGYIVYDTYEINKRMSPDEWIASSIALYLDFINLCTSLLSTPQHDADATVVLNILRLLNNSDN